MKARDVVPGGTPAVAIFTRGPHFEFDPRTGRGTTGYWKLSPRRVAGRAIIVYNRDPHTGANTVYPADYAGIQGLFENNRYLVELANVREVGTTGLNWYAFATSQGPVRYLD